jgi:ribonuclease P protein component
VARNRVRRRIRAILRELDRQQTLPPGLLQLGGRSSLIELTFDELTANVTELVTQLHRPPVSSH